MTIDLTGWNPRALPQSKALQGQQVETLKRSNPVAGWRLDVLADGAFVVKDGALQWTKEITSSDFQESYTFSTAKARNAPTFSVAAKILRDLVPLGSLTKTRPSFKGSRSFNYRLPDLQAARLHFLHKTGIDPCSI